MKLISFINENRIISFLTFLVVIHYSCFLFGFSWNGGINENFYMDNNITLEKKGSWGDLSSGHFSILAFLWLAYGVYLQRQELNEQKKQFEEQKTLNEEQMKELEIQSIQNQFDRKIARLTELEKEIAQTLYQDIHSKNGLYIFFRECKLGTKLNYQLIKLEMVFTYLKLYENLFSLCKKAPSTIDLIEELEILKKDIYANMKICFLILLVYMQFCKKKNTLFEEPNPFESLKIYHILSSMEIQAWQDIVPEIQKLTDNFTTIDTINIFEEIEPSSC